MNISELIKEARQHVIDKGFYTEKNNIGELLMLIVSELGEALEADRKKHFANMEVFENCKNAEDILLTDKSAYIQVAFETHIKDTFEDEIADVFIRLFSLCGYLKIEPEPDIPCSFKYNLENVGEILLHLTHEIINIKTYGPDEYSITRAIYYLWCAAVNNWDIDIEKYIAAKMAYNKTRPHKHGKEY